MAENYDAFAPHYDRLYSDSISQYEFRVLSRILKRHTISGSVLDLGCGTGLYLDLGFGVDPQQYLGVDISAGMLDVARRKYPRYHFVHANFCEADLAPADNVIALNAPLSYVLSGDMRFLRRLLNPGGILIATLYGKGDGTVMRRDRGRSAHSASLVRRYTLRSARAALRDFAVVSMRGMNACLPIGSSPSPLQWAANAVLERLCPSQTEHIIVCAKWPCSG